MIKKKSFLIISIFIIIGLIYLITGLKINTPYNYFILLGKSFIQGKIYLDQSFPWLNELVLGSLDRWYVVYPPMPAIISTPFIWFGLFNQTIISSIFGILNCFMLFIIVQRLYNNKIAILLTLAFAFGTNHWFLATEGSAWYFSHISATLFLLLALLVLKAKLNNKILKTSDSLLKWFFSGLALGAAYWSRLPTILALPLFIYFWFLKLSENKMKMSKKISLITCFLLGVMIFVFLNFYYNYLRFGTIWDIAYQKIPGVLDEPWFVNGIFSLKYFVRNLQFAIGKLPLYYPKFPYIKPSLEGMSLFLISPFLILVIFTLFRNTRTFIFFITGLLMMMPGLLHGTVGFSQFGYRYVFEGSLIWLISLGDVLTKKRVIIIFSFLLFLAVLINFWGILFIRYLKIYGW